MKSLQPSKTLYDLTRDMFRDAWNQRFTQAETAVKSAKRHILEIEKQVATLLSRIMKATNATVIAAYEEKIGGLEREKLNLSEKLSNRAPEKGRFDEMLELSLKFLANPYKLWESGDITLRRTVLRLAFTDHISYHRNKGPRTPKTALIFRTLRGDSDRDVCFGADGGTRTPTESPPQDFKSCVSTNSTTSACAQVLGQAGLSCNGQYRQIALVYYVLLERGGMMIWRGSMPG